MAQVIGTVVGPKGETKEVFNDGTVGNVNTDGTTYTTAPGWNYNASTGGFTVANEAQYDWRKANGFDVTGYDAMWQPTFTGVTGGANVTPAPPPASGTTPPLYNYGSIGTNLIPNIGGTNGTTNQVVPSQFDVSSITPTPAQITGDYSIDPNSVYGQSGSTPNQLSGLLGNVGNVALAIQPGDVTARQTGVNTDYNAAQYQANQYTLDPKTDTVEGRVEGLISKDSELSQMARTQALQDMNARGLLNSSMAEQAGQAAVIQNAVSIATPDAAAYAQSKRDNQLATNAALEFNTAATNTQRLASKQMELQQAQANLDRELQAAIANQDNAREIQIANARAQNDRDLAIIGSSIALETQRMRTSADIAINNSNIAARIAEVNVNAQNTIANTALQITGQLTNTDLSNQWEVFQNEIQNNHADTLQLSAQASSMYSGILNATAAAINNVTYTDAFADFAEQSALEMLTTSSVIMGLMTAEEGQAALDAYLAGDTP